MVEMYDNILQKVSYIKSLGSSIIKTEFNDDEYSFEEISSLERAALGFNLKYSQFAKYYNFKKQYKCVDLNEGSYNKENKSIVIVKYIREIKTKNNDKMAFVTVYDESVELEGVLFPLVYSKYSSILQVNNSYVISYKLENRNDKLQAIIESIYNLN